jgi:hypothetical protein
MRTPPLIIVTSSAPWGRGESFFEAEMAELSKQYDVVTLPAWPRGQHRQDWPGRTLTANGRPRTTMTAALRKLWVAAGPLTALSLGLGARSAPWKHLIALVRGAQWAMDLEREGIYPCHIHSYWISGPAAAAWSMGKLLAVGSSATAHRSDIVEMVPTWMAREFMLVRAISTQSQRWLNERGTASELVPLGALEPREAQIRPQLDGRSLRCVSIGALLPVKGHMRAIEIIRRARAAGIPATLDIVGSGSLESLLQRTIREGRLEGAVHLIGHMDHGELVQRLNSGDWNILLQTSIQSGYLREGLPVAILEGAQAGLVVVATASGSVEDFVHPSETGYLLRVEEGAAQNDGVNALLEIARFPTLAAGYARRAQEESTRYHADQVIAALRDRLQCVQ